MISEGSAPSKTVRADRDARMERRRMAWDNWSARDRSAERGFQQQIMKGVATEMLAVCAAAVLVLVPVWLFRSAELSPAVWGVLSPVLANTVSIALMGGLVWLTRIDKRSAVSATRRAARRARAAKRAKRAHDVMLSEAIATADSISLTAGGIWLDKIDQPADGNSLANCR
jgi:hypothetical protein